MNSLRETFFSLIHINTHTHTHNKAIRESGERGIKKLVVVVFVVFILAGCYVYPFVFSHYLYGLFTQQV